MDAQRITQTATHPMRRPVIDAIGYCAACLTTISFLPQLLRVLKTRSARDISLGMFSIFTLGTLCWLLYGLLLHAVPVFLANGVTLLLSGAILFLKLRFDRNATRPQQPGDAPR